MSVQDVLDELDASRGAFYHYFNSKAALLDAVVERMIRTRSRPSRPLVADPTLTAVEKLGGVFTGIARWKGERTELMLAVLEAWLADDNAIVRDKFRSGVAMGLTPVLATILEQGVAEGTFTVTSPSHAARVLVSLLQGANEAAIELWFARRAGTVPFDAVAPALGAYHTALDGPSGSPRGRSGPSTSPPSSSGSTDDADEGASHDRDHPDREAHQVVRLAPRDRRRRPPGRPGRERPLRPQRRAIRSGRRARPLAVRGPVPDEMFGQTAFPRIGELPYLLTLGPRGFFWFQLRREDSL